MAQSASREAKTEPARVWQQRSTRAAILDAGRRLVARQEPAGLTLARVADEANFSPNTVYAYFVNKSELMLAIVADDLAVLARQMRDVFPANEDVGRKEDNRPVETSARSEEREEHDPVEPPAEVVQHDDMADVPPQQEAVSDDTSTAEEEPAVEPEIAADAVRQPEPQEEVQPAPEPTDLADVEPETTVDVEPQEPPPAELSAKTAADIEPPAEPHEELERAAESIETAPMETASEAVATVDWHEPAVTDEPVAPQANEESVEQHSAPDIEPDVSVSAAPEYEANVDEVSETVDAHPTTDAHDEMPDTQVAEEITAEQPEADDQHENPSLLARLQETVARLEARPVDAWLERRLRELERMIATLEERHGNNERTTGAASGLLEEALRDLQSRMEAVEKNRQLDFSANANAFGERMDTSEKRQREMFGELRSLTMLASSRLDALESNTHKPAGFGHFDFTPAVEPAAVLPDAPKAEAKAETDTADAPVEGAPATETSYLSQARRSAMAAAAQAVPPPADSMQRFASTMSSIKTASTSSRYIIGGGIALLLFLLGVGLALKRQAGDAPVPVRIASAAHAKAVSGQTMAPQIRVASLANRGNADAQLLLGLEYLDGTGAVKSENNAAQWISRAAQRGNAVAQYWLATLYADGKGVKADPALAMHWYEEAAMQGNRKAMHQLAVSYAEGWGATRNYAEAARWFSRAASLGYVDSAFNLGVLYERGLGMPQSLLDAYKWYSIAAAMGDKGSPPRLAVLKTQMSADDIAGATQAAGSFTPDTMDPVANATPQVAQLPKA